MNTIFVMIDINMSSKLMKNIPLNRYKYVLLTVLFFISVITSANNLDNTPYRIKTIVVDAGHGGTDGATKGVFSREKDIALQVALRLGKAIEENLKDVKVVYEIIEPIIDGYCNQLIDIYDFDKDTYDKIFEVLSTIRTDKKCVDILKTILIRV